MRWAKLIGSRARLLVDGASRASKPPLILCSILCIGPAASGLAQQTYDDSEQSYSAVESNTSSDQSIEPDVSEGSEDSEFENLPTDDVNDAHRAILERGEFDRLTRKEEEETEEEAKELPAWLERFFDWLGELLSGSSGETPESRSALPMMTNLVYLAAGTLLVAVIAIIAIAMFKKERDTNAGELADSTGSGSMATPPGHQSPNAYMERASELASKGDFRLAIRELLLGAMSFLERSGAIRYRRGLTNRDYLYSARGEKRKSLSVIIRVFELIFYGRREATRENFSECLQLFAASFKELETDAS